MIPVWTTGSLFSSGGGWEVGAVRAGLRPIWGVEFDPARAALWSQTFPRAFPGCFVGDVRDQRVVPRVDVLFTSPVCRDFSISRSRVDASTVDDTRPMLGLATLAYVEQCEPDVVMLENVPAYATAKPYLLLRDGMVQRGYTVKERALNAADFGNPSNRNRLFSVFLRKGTRIGHRWPKPTGRTSWDVALGSILSDLPAISSTGALERNLQALKAAGRKLSYPMLFVSQKQGVINGTPNYLVPAGKPAPTLIVGHSAITGWRVLLSPKDIRRVDARAARLLNGFPLDYGLGIHDKVVADTTGDAVSPIMAEALLKGLFIKKENQ